MTSNSSRSRVLNLVYRLINAFEGKNADIERSGLYKHYDVNKYSVKISLNNRKTKVPGRLIHTNMMEIIAIKTIAAIIILSIYSFLIFDGYFLSIPGREFISNSISIS